MFRFRVKKQIHSGFTSGSSRDVVLYRDVETPFPPYKGLTLIIGDDEFTLERIYFDVEKQEFRTHVESDRELHLRHPDPNSRSISEIVKEYIDIGWKDLDKQVAE